jgi:hypothetical protein
LSTHKDTIFGAMLHRVFDIHTLKHPQSLHPIRPFAFYFSLLTSAPLPVSPSLLTLSPSHPLILSPSHTMPQPPPAHGAPAYQPNNNYNNQPQGYVVPPGPPHNANPNAVAGVALVPQQPLNTIRRAHSVFGKRMLIFANLGLIMMIYMVASGRWTRHDLYDDSDNWLGTLRTSPFTWCYTGTGPGDQEECTMLFSDCTLIFIQYFQDIVDVGGETCTRFIFLQFSTVMTCVCFFIVLELVLLKLYLIKCCPDSTSLQNLHRKIKRKFFRVALGITFGFILLTWLVYWIQFSAGSVPSAFMSNADDEQSTRVTNWRIYMWIAVVFCSTIPLRIVAKTPLLDVDAYGAGNEGDHLLANPNQPNYYPQVHPQPHFHPQPQQQPFQQQQQQYQHQPQPQYYGQYAPGPAPVQQNSGQYEGAPSTSGAPNAPPLEMNNNNNNHNDNSNSNSTY